MNGHSKASRSSLLGQSNTNHENSCPDNQLEGWGSNTGPFVHEVGAPTIRSFLILSYDRSIASSKASFLQRAIWPFAFQFQVSSRFLKNHPVAAHVFFLVFAPLISRHIFPSITCFRRQFLLKMQHIPHPLDCI